MITIACNNRAADNSMIIRKILATFLVTLLTTSMVVSPAVAQFDSLTLKKEREMGKEFDSMLRARMPMVEDPMITDYIKGIVDRIVEAKRPMPFEIKSAVINNQALNAFAIPGGYIYVFTGLILNVQDESQLAGVIAHELGHVSERHMARRLEKAKTVSIATMAGVVAGVFLGIAGGGHNAKNLGSALIAGSQAGGAAAMLGYSRDDEREADHVGLSSLVKAGYNPKGMPEMFTLMQKKKWFSGGGDIPSYLSTHPGLTERTTYLNERISRMSDKFTERTSDNAMLKKVQVLLRSKLTTPEDALGYFKSIPDSDVTALDYMGRGIALLRLKKMAEAEEWYTKALALDENDPIILREAGWYYYKVGNSAKAAGLLQKSIIKKPDDALSMFYLSLLQAENGDYEQAIPTMRRVLQIVPEDGEVHYYLGKFLGESGDTFNGHLHLAYSYIYYMKKDKARYHLGKATALAKTPDQEEKVKEVKELLGKRFSK